MLSLKIGHICRIVEGTLFCFSSSTWKHWFLKNHLYMSGVELWAKTKNSNPKQNTACYHRKTTNQRFKGGKWWDNQHCSQVSGWNEAGQREAALIVPVLTPHPRGQAALLSCSHLPIQTCALGKITQAHSCLWPQLGPRSSELRDLRGNLRRVQIKNV